MLKLLCLNSEKVNATIAKIETSTNAFIAIATAAAASTTSATTTSGTITTLIPAVTQVTIFTFTLLIIYMKKLLDSDWLGLMQFSGDSKQKMVNSVQRSNKLDILIGQ